MPDCSSYDPGQCTWGACDATGWIPPGLGNGGQWAGNYAARGGAVTMTPTAGSVVCYAGGDGYSVYGHVAVVTSVVSGSQFWVHEMNYVGPYVWDDRLSNMYDVAGFLLPPGGSPGTPPSGGQGAGPAPGQSGPGQDSVVNAWSHFLWWVDIWLGNAGDDLNNQAIAISQFL